MTQYKAKITEQQDSFYALIIRVDHDGEQQVCSDYKGRFFNTRKAAEKSANAYIAKQ
jgi:demethoxyubiquinone hydroxylase (CLK1/Coq7/Cat5 family)